MKKIVLTTIILIFAVYFSSAYFGITLASPHGKNFSIHTRPHYSNPEKSHIIVTPPLPHPKRETYIFKDFVNIRRFPHRSYYVPSYCIPQTRFFNNFNNPFCSQYMPYGTNIYFSF